MSLPRPQVKEQQWEELEFAGHPTSRPMKNLEISPEFQAATVLEPSRPPEHQQIILSASHSLCCVSSSQEACYWLWATSLKFTSSLTGCMLSPVTGKGVTAGKTSSSHVPEKEKCVLHEGLLCASVEDNVASACSVSGIWLLG